jgi:hypothetical protein
MLRLGNNAQPTQVLGYLCGTVVVGGAILVGVVGKLVVVPDGDDGKLGGHSHVRHVPLVLAVPGHIVEATEKEEEGEAHYSLTHRQAY